MAGGSNRGRYVVTSGGPWRLYTHALPGWQMLGTIQRGMDIGALGLSPARLLAQINAGVLRTLDQRKATAAVAAANRESHMAQQAVGIVVPAHLDFSDLRLRRDPATGDVDFEIAPIAQICSASGIDMALMVDAPEDNVSGLIVAWYRHHLAAGGAPDATAEELIEEARLEDLHGGGLSHPPGSA